MRAIKSVKHSYLYKINVKKRDPFQQDILPDKNTIRKTVSSNLIFTNMCERLAHIPDSIKNRHRYSLDRIVSRVAHAIYYINFEIRSNIPLNFYISVGEEFLLIGRGELIYFDCIDQAQLRSMTVEIDPCMTEDAVFDKFYSKGRKPYISYSVVRFTAKILQKKISMNTLRLSSVDLSLNLRSLKLQTSSTIPGTVH